MSRDRDKSLIMLSLIPAWCSLLLLTNSYARTDIKLALQTAKDKAEFAISKWGGRVFSDRAYVTHCLRESAGRIQHVSARAVVLILEQLCIDLAEKHGFIKAQLVEPILREIQAVVKFVDPEGNHWQDRDIAVAILNDLYEIMETYEARKPERKAKKNTTRRRKALPMVEQSRHDVLPAAGKRD